MPSLSTKEDLQLKKPIIEVKQLVKYFPVHSGFFGRKKNYLKAVDGISLYINPGETLGLVGESGSGKSTVGNLILHLIREDNGTIIFNGLDISKLKERELRQLRPKLQMVFQDPLSSLDPRMTVKKIVGSPLLLNKLVTRSQANKKVLSILQEVGLSKSHMERYPHEFSGGQKQRIGIARALVTDPEFIIFDEPTSALDMSVQAQILNLIMDLQERYSYAYLFISHDLTVVRHVSRRIAVMYMGTIVETASKNDLFSRPRHPYTKALMDAVPLPDPMKRRNLAVLKGDTPSAINIPQGCRFHTRCPDSMDICRRVLPPRVTLDKGHEVVCHLYK
jgi:peptide/nickel transport system ATP-binding protein/oligopeptide transport system ATP-binding protein